MEIPMRGPNCPTAIIIPEAVIKPETTEWERNLATNPNFRKPRTV